MLLLISLQAPALLPDVPVQPFQGVVDEGVGFNRGDEESPWDFDTNPDFWY